MTEINAAGSLVETIIKIIEARLAISMGKAARRAVKEFDFAAQRRSMGEAFAVPPQMLPHAMKLPGAADRLELPRMVEHQCEARGKFYRRVFNARV